MHEKCYLCIYIINKVYMKTVIIGTGNVAWHLSWALRGAGHEVLQVVGRSEEKAAEVAGRVGAEALCSYKAVRPDADAYVIAVKDDAVRQVAAALPKELRGVVMHTAGSVPLSVFDGITENAAVLYPMQSFTKGRELRYEEIPFFIEAANEASLQTVRSLAESVSQSVRYIDSQQRLMLHLAAVFASNMANHCYTLAERIVNEAGIDFALYGPLIRETAAKASVMSPRVAQTGPMRRGDKAVMEKQMGLLSDPMMREFYALFAKSIRDERINILTN